MNVSDSVIDGLSARGEQQLRMVVREEMQAALAEFQAAPDCPRPCADVDALETTVYGNGTSGLKDRMTTMERQVENLVWLSRTALGAAIAATVGVVIQLLTR